jgi:hypothetical protein
LTDAGEVPAMAGFFGSSSLMVMRVAKAMLLGLQWRHRRTI